MNAQTIVEELRGLGSEATRKTLIKHGATGEVLGVKVEELKKIQKRIKKDYRLALDLYATGIADAMYLAGLIADDAAMTREDLDYWVEQAASPMLSEYTVAWVAAGSPHGHQAALDWIESAQESVASSGWCTLASEVGIKPNSELDLEELKRLLKRVEKTILKQPNRVRYSMNMFVISVGGYVQPLHDTAVATAERLGHVQVDMNGTACKVPYAPDYIQSMVKRGSLEKKRKTAKC